MRGWYEISPMGLFVGILVLLGTGIGTGIDIGASIWQDSTSVCLCKGAVGEIS